VTVRLTAAGQRLAHELLTARAAPLARLLDALDDEENATLGTLLAKLLARAYREVGDAELLCRLCDRHACTADASCPIGQAERDQVT
jgi:MarR family transcriptional repressor of emrRAB